MEKIELRTHKPMKPTRMTSIEETVQLTRIQQQNTSSSGAIYDRKPNQKALKVLTVAAYILFVSMAAITLSFYYVFIWDPSTKPLPAKTPIGCENQIVVPESLAIQLANSSDVSAENFLKILLRTYEQQKKHPQRQSEKMVLVKELNEPPLLSIPKPNFAEPTDQHHLGQSFSDESITSKLDKLATTEEAATFHSHNTSPEAITMPFQSSTADDDAGDRPYMLLDVLQPSRLIANKPPNIIERFAGEDDDLDDGDDDGEDYAGSGGRAESNNSSSQFPENENA